MELSWSDVTIVFGGYSLPKNGDIEGDHYPLSSRRPVYSLIALPLPSTGKGLAGLQPNSLISTEMATSTSYVSQKGEFLL